ncbi:uncharacterized protein K489DRAFT_382902 [Dissoconium aciculare CBS 342.82]|uniref:P-loop containing nucleoside triphosphate hydrolase protein n=1 Tax=Dissoconium aciculare CBS 342.82 TaxID=1314786 RepID=A0A6J3LZT5_9PEZI|nr:uncharacterized protein K489DRAFT_382902 [Dissoconium aciculare CBS 342.82]KAF1820147.1 hypothetical protein K489DRAFT_382902 [Dissoconium aciculare CBS 342.82]
MEGNQVVVVDGFPRDIEQVNFLSGTNFQPYVVLLFDCPGDIARDRYLHRDIAGRDKSPAIFARRYVEFVRLNQAVLEAFKEVGVLLTVDTSRETETSYKHLLKALQESKYNLC